MEKFLKLDSTIMPLNIENIDTDQIIPARFLKAVTRDGFGDNLFRDWRYDNDEKLIEDFNLNNIKNDSKILLAGRNFGCGSSREHAAWAIYDYGFRVVVSSFFADIFRNNALNNGLLVIQLDQHKIDKIFDLVSKNIDSSFSVDLNEQRFYSSDGKIDERFEINDYNKTCLINGYDNIDYLLSIKDKILKFESNK
jgi:3-isopropylmalate/(R)-2-methylmalate dehydratase small subunit|tara:strand:- start:645 stop:1229 length:585 start_codon:yes stop_codon:yes gene_type:complete